jgi:hypothetical protein
LGQNNRLQLWTTTATIMLSFPPPNEIRSSTCYLTGVAPALFLVGGGHCFLVGGVDVSVLLTPSAWLIALHSKFYFLLPVRPHVIILTFIFFIQHNFLSVY